MKKNLFFALATIFAANEITSQNIATVRSSAVGSTVTVKGIVTNGPELGIIRYLQDGSGGISAYGSTLTPVAPGDSISVTGTLKLFNNLLELDPVSSFAIVASKPVPAANVITPATFDETKEGTLVRFLNCTFAVAGNFAGNTNYTVTSGGQTFVMRVVTTASTVVGTPIPAGPVTITGIASQFCSTPTVGCTSGYQLLVRTINDIGGAAPSGIYEWNINKHISVYPNPSNSVINFNIGNEETISSITVTDIYGRIVVASKENLTSINITNLSNGIYNLFVSSNKQNYQTKFSVEK